MDPILKSRLSELENADPKRAEYLRSVIAEAHGDEAVPAVSRKTKGPRSERATQAPAETPENAG